MLLASLSILPALSLAKFVVPLPDGPYGVSIQDTLLTDFGLPDAYLDLNYRRVPISIISPTGSSADCEPVLQPYMPNVTAAFWEQAFLSSYGLSLNDTLTRTELILCKPHSLNYSTPVVLFAPGAGTSRYLYNILGSAIVAQTGYTVITYDSPGQTEIEVFPNGDVERASNSSVSATYLNAHAVATVVEDGLIVLNAIFPNTDGPNEGKANITADPALPGALTNTTKAAMIGHSQGGAASLAGLLVDTRLSAGANMDGGLNATADNIAVCSDSNTLLNCNTSTTTKPFMLLEHQGSNQTTADGWTDVWNNVLQGSKWQIQLNNTQHGSFGDFPYIMDLYGLQETENSTLVNYAVGSVPGAKVLEILSEVFCAFLGHSFLSTDERPADNVTATVAELEMFGVEIVNQTIVE